MTIPDPPYVFRISVNAVFGSFSFNGKSGNPSLLLASGIEYHFHFDGLPSEYPFTLEDLNGTGSALPLSSLHLFCSSCQLRGWTLGMDTNRQRRWTAILLLLQSCPLFEWFYSILNSRVFTCRDCGCENGVNDFSHLAHGRPFLQF